MNKTIRVTFAAVLCIGLAACATKQEVKPSAAPAPAPAPEVTTQPTEPTGPAAFTPADLSSNDCLLRRTVYFDLDQSVIKPQFQDAIACHAKYLRDRPDARMTLEGNADERGSREYNLGLGERRANAVASALEAEGASAAQIKVVSYGEERPVCREHNESCWSRNRRAEIVYTVK
ncbi:MAG TPA: peptidoglycan-associated lipoprotein Pal [Rhodanobacteraceae bacterium]|nr:peptidoglycan-associated lipoprotein Pal [Rhodanobacteraceae bacterium]